VGGSGGSGGRRGGGRGDGGVGEGAGSRQGTAGGGLGDTWVEGGTYYLVHSHRSRGGGAAVKEKVRRKAGGAFRVMGGGDAIPGETRT